MRFPATALALILVGMAVFEVTMQPNAEERWGALLLFGIVATGIAVAASILPGLARRLSSLRATIVILGGTSLLVLVLALMVAGGQMFISEHDLNLLWVLVGFGVTASFAFGLAVSGPLTRDLRKISITSAAIAGGNLRARTGVSRRDEAGRLARDVDVMADALEDAASARSREEQARRRLFAAVGHDLRTPLASMRAAIEAFQDDLVDDRDRYLTSMASDVDALGGLVDDIFLMARLESGDIVLDPEPVDLTEIADEAIGILRPIAKARDVTVRLEAIARVEAFGSSQATARVVRNLVDNAVRHSPPRGEVVVTLVDGDRAHCTVTDQGPGFAPDFVSTAFERFTRHDESRARDGGAAGLGLAIAKGYVNALGGEIWADPGPGGSVSFWLPVPHPVGDESADGRARSPLQATPRSGERPPRARGRRC